MSQLQDPLTMAARRLGEAKTKATEEGTRMLETFEHLQKAMAVLKQHGLSITIVEFENKALQAAWREYTTNDWTGEMPLMQTEDELADRFVGRI